MINGILQTLISASASIVVLFLLAKIMGARQISQLSFFDYINGITIGSIAAELAVAGISTKALVALIAMVIYAIIAELVSYLTNKSIVLRKLLVGTPMVLFDNGKLYEKNLMKAKLDINEFLTFCRNDGYFDLSEIETAILETNGQISILPKSCARPATPADLNMIPEQSQAVHNVIIDGKIMVGCLKSTGNNRDWLSEQLKAQNASLAELILATCDANNVFTVYKKTGEYERRNIFI